MACEIVNYSNLHIWPSSLQRLFSCIFIILGNWSLESLWLPQGTWPISVRARTWTQELSNYIPRSSRRFIEVFQGYPVAKRVGEGQTGSTPSPMPHFRVPPLLLLLCIGLQHKISFKERMFFSLKKALEKFFLITVPYYDGLLSQ